MKLFEVKYLINIIIFIVYSQYVVVGIKISTTFYHILMRKASIFAKKLSKKQKLLIILID